jgi:Tol biopolymer transport system component
LTRFPKAKPPPPPFDFAVPTDLPLNSTGFDGGPSISDDGLSLFFISDRPGGQGGDVWMATRATTSGPFLSPANLGPVVNGPGDEGAPSISSDGLSLYFDSDASRQGGQGSGDIWVTTRPSTSAPFGAAANLGPTINTSFAEGHPDISADGLSLYFSSGRPGTCGEGDIWVARRPTTTEPFGIPVNLGPAVNTCASDEEPSISADGLALFFSSSRPGGSGMHDLWVATRSSTSAPFGHAVNLGRTVNSRFDDRTPDIASDGATLYFMSNRPGGVGFFDLWESRRTQ